MARRTKSVDNLVQQVLRMRRNYGDGERMQKAARIAQRYITNITSTSRYNRLREEMYKAAVEGDGSKLGQARKAQFSRSTYMGLAGSKG